MAFTSDAASRSGTAPSRVSLDTATQFPHGTEFVAGWTRTADDPRGRPGGTMKVTLNQDGRE